MSLLKIYYNPEILKEGYHLSPSGMYTVPVKSNYNSCLEAIRNLPLDTKPEVFCLHDNAEITRNQLETESFFRSILATQAQSESGGAKSNEQIVLEVAQDMLSKLPEAFDIAKVSEKYPVSYNESMNTVLLQELIRFRNLTEVVRESLKNIQKAIKGLVIMSSELEDVYTSILVGKIPSIWASKSYPSMKPLGSYYADLLQRLLFFRKWIDEGQPIIFWLSGLFFTQSFLTGCLQNYARKYTIPIDLLAFEFKVLSVRTAGTSPPIISQERLFCSESAKLDIFSTLDSRPEEGQYVNGLFLEGARWDVSTGVIGESLPKVLYDSIPIIWLKPGERSRFSYDNTYDCPVYKTSARRGTLSTTGYVLRVFSRKPVLQVANLWNFIGTQLIMFFQYASQRPCLKTIGSGEVLLVFCSSMINCYLCKCHK